MLMSCIVACTCHATAAASSVPSAPVSLLAAPSGRSEHNEIHAPANLLHDLIKVACAGSGDTSMWTTPLNQVIGALAKTRAQSGVSDGSGAFTMLKILLRFVPEFSSDMCTHTHTHSLRRMCVYTHPLRRAHNDATFSSLKCLPAFVTVFAAFSSSFFFLLLCLSASLLSPLIRCSALL